MAYAVLGSADVADRARSLASDRVDLLVLFLWTAVLLVMLRYL
jgi:hypothetical protein